MRLHSPHNMLEAEDSTGAKPRNWGGGADESRMHFDRQPWEMLTPHERRQRTTVPEGQPRRTNACSELALPLQLVR